MTDEKLARDYAEHNQGKYTNEFGNLYHAFLAGLKAEVKNNEDLATVAYMQGAEQQKKKADKQLTKAKEIIEKLLNAFASNDFFEEEELCAMAEAEQFLEESNNDKA